MLLKMVFSVNLPLNLSVVFALFMLVTITSADDVKSADFDVIPGGARNHFQSEEWHGITCTFTYVCQGGTKEHWVITVRRDDDFNYKCVVERPEGLSVSYLFFQEFRIDVTGAVVEGAEVEGKDVYHPLNEEQFIVDKENNLVRSSPKFGNELNRIDVFLKRQKGTKEDL